MDFSSLPPTLGVEGLAALLHAAPQTVKNNASRAPEKLPPPVRTGGRRLIWITRDVFTWLEARRAAPAPAALVAHPAAPDAPPFPPRVSVAPAGGAAPPKRGRPTKAEQLARRARGV
jgi:hypothetical protein